MNTLNISLKRNAKQVNASKNVRRRNKHDRSRTLLNLKLTALKFQFLKAPLFLKQPKPTAS